MRYAEAYVSKALFDHLYLRSIPPAFRSLNINLAEDLRLNIDELSYKEREEFGLYVEESGNRKMRQIYENFRSTLWQP